MEETYKLLEDGRVEFVYKTDTAELKALDNETVIGEYHNLGVNYIKDKETCVNDLQEKFNKYSEDLDSINNQLEQIKISDTLAEELKQFIDKTVEIFKAIGEIKDFSSEDYVANNPKKFGKMLKEARLLKENAIGELKEIDKITGLYNKKTELKGQKELYDKEVSKIARQLAEVKEL